MKKLPFVGLLLMLTACELPQVKTENQAEIQAFKSPPSWAKEVVWYQIFVERFYNGDTSNDPTTEDIVGSYPGFIPKGWKITPWTQGWYEDDAYFSELNGKTDAQGNPIKEFSQKLQLRRYGGDLAGVFQKLDYLEDLGITAIYFNPLNDAPSLHKYDARNWRHIDVNFGPRPEADKKLMAQESILDADTWQITSADSLFIELVKELHRRNIKVILDYSWNHTGTEFTAWKDILKNGANSPYKDWYWVESFDDQSTDSNEFAYKGWLGLPGLPEIKETHKQDHTAALEPLQGDVFSPQVKNLIFNVTRKWLDPNGDGNTEDGIDGFRLDVAAEMPLTFWRQYRKVVRKLNPEAYLIGEIWWKEFPNDLMDPSPYLQGDMFDAVMNYRWYRSARHYFAEAPSPLQPAYLVDSLTSFFNGFDSSFSYSMMNVAATHDVPRLATSLFNSNPYKFEATAKNASYKIQKPDSFARLTQKLLLLQQFTYVGAPSIWNGDEMGMWGADDPDCRKPLIWPEFTFENEQTHPYGYYEINDVVKFDSSLYAYYQALIALRKNQPALSFGTLAFDKDATEKGLFAYERSHGKDNLKIIFNNSGTAASLETNYKTQIFGLHGATLSEGQLRLPPRSAAVLSMN